MAAVQDSDPVAARTDARRRPALQGFVFLTAAGGLALTLLVFYPGYSTVDARYVYADAQAWRFGDWQSPMMAVLWRLVDPIAPGSMSISATIPLRACICGRRVSFRRRMQFTVSAISPR